MKALMLSAVVCMMRSRASLVAQEMCGVMMQFFAVLTPILPRPMIPAVLPETSIIGKCQ